MKRILAILLAMLMLVSIVACTKDQPGDQTDGTGSSATADTTAAPEDTKELTEIERRALLDDELPEMTFENTDFIFLVNPLGTYFVEDYTGEAVNDSKVDRNRAVEERFGVKITEMECSNDKNAIAAYIDQLNAAGDADAYHVASVNMIMNGAPAIAGSYMNWYEIPHIDFEKEWWPDSNIDCLTVNGSAYMIIQDACVNTVNRTSCMFYDKVMADAYNLPNLYELIRDGKWTYDKLVELAASIYDDTNRDGVRDVDDYYGLVSGIQSNLNTYLWAFGNQIYTRQADGSYEYTYYTDRTIQTIENIVALFNNYEGVYGDLSSHHLGGIKFSEGKALFANGLLYHTISYMGNMENEYGIIPYPKMDEEQKNYATMVDGGAHSVAVPMIAEDLDLIGIVMESMAAETYKKVLPVYLDQTLKLRYSSSPEDAEMVDLILATRVFDIGYIYDNWKGVSFKLERLVRDNSTNIASDYATFKDSALEHYAKVFEMFEN